MKLKRNIYYSGLLFSFLIFFTPLITYTQNVRELTLEDAIELAQEQSLDAFISKNMYLVSYWEYRSYKAEKRPWLSFSPQPVEYNNSSTLELNDSGLYEPRQKDYLSTNGMFALSQNIALTGAKVSMYSSLDRAQNFQKSENSVSFNSSPITIGISQPLFQYNQYKWKKKTEPVKFEKAKKEYIESVEEIARQAVYYFFNLLDAQQTFNIAGLNKVTADTFYHKSLGRYERGAIALKDLQRLELNQLNSALGYESAQLELKRIEFSLKSFLRLSENEEIKLVIPDSFPTIKINPQLALEKALENNSNILDYKQRLIESDENIARARGETGIQSNLNVNLGWGKSGNTLESVYYDLDKNRNVRLGLYVPIVDWGLSKGYREMAKFNKEVVVARVEKERIEFEQDVMMSAIEFNMLESQLNSVTKAREIAEKSYKTISERFLLGKENLETLYAARNERDNALRSYYRKLREIWIYYYYMRGITLYDFEKGQGLVRNFDDLFGL